MFVLIVVGKKIAISLIDRVSDADGLDGLFARSTQAIKMVAVTLLAWSLLFWFSDYGPVADWKVPTLHSMTSFAIVRYNHRTFQSGGVVAVVRGQAAAQKLLLAFQGSQGENEGHAGWRYFLEETDLAPGMEADKATKIRQARLDRQDSRT